MRRGHTVAAVNVVAVALFLLSPTVALGFSPAPSAVPAAPGATIAATGSVVPAVPPTATPTIAATSTITPAAPATLTIGATSTVTIAATATVTATPTVPAVPAPAPVMGTRVENGYPLAFGGSWGGGRSTVFSGGSYVYASRAGSTVKICFKGTALAVIGPVGPSYGRAELVVDGISRGTFSQYAAAYAYQQRVFTVTGLSDSPHIAYVRVLGAREFASTGTVIVFDAFDISSATGAPVLFSGFDRAEETDARLTFAGLWPKVAAAGYSGGGYTYTSAGGVTISAAFSGQSLTIVGNKGPGSGIIRVVVDGVARGDVSLYSPASLRRQAVFTLGGLSGGTHTLRIIALGTHEAASTGSVVVLDAVEVSSVTGPAAFYGGFQRAEDYDGRLAYRGIWVPVRSAAYSGGSYRYAGKAGSTAMVVFYGSRLVVYGSRGPSFGRFEILVDGVSKGVTDCYAPAYARGAVAAVDGLALGTAHTLTLRVLGTRNYSSTGTTVVLDGLETISARAGSPAKFERVPAFGYPWSTYIVVDKSDFRLYWVRNGVLRRVYPIAHGKPSTPTPVAVWRIDQKLYTDPLGVYGPRKFRLFRLWGGRFVFTAFGIHGTNQPWVIGTRASHGCIRMYNRDVLVLFPEVPLHTMVVTRE